MNYKLMDEITKILILCNYEDKCGDTPQERQYFEKRAIDAYQGKTADPSKIISNVFHARVNRTAALIFDAIANHGEIINDSTH
ncbi:hypothetical protein KA005_14045 [bacterium]|nr:hypothetical protein [bacterium]